MPNIQRYLSHFNSASITSYSWLHQTLSAYLVFSLSLLLCGLAHADNTTNKPNISIEKLQHLQQNNHLTLNSDIRFQLSEQIISAIHHEIPISFKTEIILSEKKQILGIKFERTRSVTEYHTQIYTHGVNQYYVLYNTRNLKRQRFPSLDNALQTLGTLKTFPVIELSELHPEQNYSLKMRISIDPWLLPAPLILESIFDKNWQLSSGWFEIKMQTPKSWM